MKNSSTLTFPTLEKRSHSIYVPKMDIHILTLNENSFSSKFQSIKHKHCIPKISYWSSCYLHQWLFKLLRNYRVCFVRGWHHFVSHSIMNLFILFIKFSLFHHTEWNIAYYHASPNKLGLGWNFAQLLSLADENIKSPHRSQLCFSRHLGKSLPISGSL